MDKVKNLLSPLASGTINDTLVSLQNSEPLSRAAEECQRTRFLPETRRYWWYDGNRPQSVRLRLERVCGL